MGDRVDVIDLADEGDCAHEMFLMIEYDKDGLAVPLSQLKPINTDKETREAVEDWHYWFEKGYEF